MEETPKDWRGTPIVPGALVIYGAPVGRSIALVEAEVVGFTKSGRVNVRVVRRAYGSWGEGKEIVHVGTDRLTIVTELPPTDMPTDKEKEVIRKAENAERERVYNTHRFQYYSYAYNTGQPAYNDRECEGCGYRHWPISNYECPA